MEGCSYELKEENGKKGEEKLLVLLSGVDPPQLFTERSCLRSSLQVGDGILRSRFHHAFVRHPLLGGANLGNGFALRGWGGFSFIISLYSFQLVFFPLFVLTQKVEPKGQGRHNRSACPSGPAHNDQSLQVMTIDLVSRPACLFCLR